MMPHPDGPIATGDTVQLGGWVQATVLQVTGGEELMAVVRVVYSLPALRDQPPFQRGDLMAAPTRCFRRVHPPPDPPARWLTRSQMATVRQAVAHALESQADPQHKTDYRDLLDVINGHYPDTGEPLIAITHATHPPARDAPPGATPPLDGPGTSPPVPATPQAAPPGADRIAPPPR